MLKVLKILLLLALPVSIVAGCNNEKSYKSPEQAFIASNISSNGIIKKVELTDGAIIFYKGLNNDVGVGLVRNCKGRWKWMMGSGMVNQYNEPMSFAWANLDQMKEAGQGYHLFWGSVNNDEIYQLHIAYNNGWDLSEDAILFDTGLGFRVWYVISTKYYGTIPGINATGYDGEGKVIYQNY